MILLKKKETILNVFKKKTILLFTSNWCNSCFLLKKKINILEKNINFFILNVNIDYYHSILINYNIRNIPCLFINNKNKKIIVGNISIKKILIELNSFL